VCTTLTESSVICFVVLVSVMLFSVSCTRTSRIHAFNTLLIATAWYCVPSTICAGAMMPRCSMPTWLMRPANVYVTTEPPGGFRYCESKESVSGTSMEMRLP